MACLQTFKSVKHAAKEGTTVIWRTVSKHTW